MKKHQPIRNKKTVNGYISKFHNFTTYKHPDPEVQKKLDALKTLEGIWANKDTSFFDREK